MMNYFSHFPSHILNGLLAFSAFTLLLTGCSTPPPQNAVQNPNTPTRTELVLLNVPEGSGWVAYRKDENSDEVEDYRIVVIRQSGNELIYDSVIPLAASMETHGFELAKDDPRLRNLALNVDSNIIEPLESVMPEQPAVSDAQRLEIEADNAMEMNDAEASTPPETPTPTPEADVTEEAPADRLPELIESDRDYPLLQRNGDEVIIGMPAKDSLQPGDRLFVREADRTITLPGEEEQQLVSRGSLTGLVQVEAVSGRIATTILLSGYLPEDPLFEMNK